MKKGDIVYVKSNGLRRTDASQGVIDSMFDMQSQKYKIQEISTDGVRIGNYWFDKFDVVSVEILEIKPPEIKYFNVEDLVV